jgi:hypothetical protein
MLVADISDVTRQFTANVAWLVLSIFVSRRDTVHVGAAIFFDCRKSGQAHIWTKKTSGCDREHPIIGILLLSVPECH